MHRSVILDSLTCPLFCGCDSSVKRQVGVFPDPATLPFQIRAPSSCHLLGLHRVPGTEQRGWTANAKRGGGHCSPLCCPGEAPGLIVMQKRATPGQHNSTTKNNSRRVVKLQWGHFHITEQKSPTAQDAPLLFWLQPASSQCLLREDRTHTVHAHTNTLTVQRSPSPHSSMTQIG